jgi:hypothetical protein
LPYHYGPAWPISQWFEQSDLSLYIYICKDVWEEERWRRVYKILTVIGDH